VNAICEVHRNIIIHDIKHQNFLLFYKNYLNTSIDSSKRTGILKLTDIGLAQVLKDNKLFMKYKSGTYSYQASQIMNVYIVIFRIVGLINLLICGRLDVTLLNGSC
jgi:serine/threonine protein kinase